MDLVYTICYYTFTVLYIYAAVVVVVMILLENRSPVKTLSWIMIMIMFPIVGIIIYAFFGQDFRRRKIVNYKRKLLNPISNDAQNLEDIKQFDIPVHSQKLITMLHNNSRAELYSGANIDVYTSGTETFESLFRDIENAKAHIHVEFYIIVNDEVGRKFLDLLSKKAKEGVRVRVIYDYFGGWTITKKILRQLRADGVYIQPFLPADSVFGFSRINYRNHRKIVVVDGKIGYTGGLNVAERYRKGNSLGLWRDTFIRVTGTAVHGLQNIFLNDWNFVDKKDVNDEKYYPTSEDCGTAYMQSVMSGPDTDWENIMQGVVTAISNAVKFVYIHTPYYLPTESLMTAIETAALSGIDVRIMIPERNDNRLVAAASRSYMRRLLDVGVRVYFYKRNFLHSKAIVIDDEISIVGTANMDVRSYEQNFEVAAFIYHEQTAQLLKKKYEEDMEDCRELNINIWKHRSRWIKLKESVARLFSPLL